MRVLRISHSGTVGPWRERERAQRRLGDDVRLLTARTWHAGGTTVELDDADDWVIPARTWGRHPALFLYSPAPLWRALGEQWDLIDIHEEPFALATAEVRLIRWLRRTAAPFTLYSAQNIAKRYPLPFRWLEHQALRTAGGISACNAEAAAITEDKGFPGRARVIPLGVDLATFTPSDRDAPGADDAVVVGFVGRLVEEKGVQTLLDALVTEPRMHARIAGSGPLDAELRARAQQARISDRLTFVGAVAPDEMPLFYRSIDVLAVPSIPTPSWTEQFGRVAVEAMASGVPVVSSDAGALPDVVGGAGIVVPHSDANALSAALLAAAGPDRERLRAAGFARSRECTWDAVAVAYRDLYRSTISAEPEGESAAPLEVIVVAYGAPELLRRALTPVAELPVTVIDNSSSSEIRELCAELGIRYLDPGANLGFGSAVNRVLRDRLHPGGDVLLLNPDAVIDPSDIAELHHVLRSDARRASVGPAQVDERGHRARVQWPFPSPFGSWLNAAGLGRLRPAGSGFVIGSVLLLRAEALAQVGGFDERFFLYAEETDWSYRAFLLGWRHAAVPHIEAVHAGAGTSTDPRRREAMFFASQERYLRKHFGSAGWASARFAGWLGAMLRALLLPGERRSAARRRAAIYRLGPVRVEGRFRSATPAGDG